MIALWIGAACFVAQSPAPVIVGASATMVPQGAAQPATFDARTLARILQHSPLGAPPPDPTNRFAGDEGAARLGQALFYDARVSKNGQVSCASCHDPHKAFSDGRATAVGMGAGTRNAPSLYNVAWQRWLFWDGRADSTWSQALQPMESATELGTDRATLVKLVAGDAALRADYERTFGALVVSAGKVAGGDADGVPNGAEVDRAFVNLGKSLAAFERKLVSANSPFDRFASALRANDTAGQAAYPEAARRGLALFVGKADCRLCHSGPLFSDGEFHDIGIPSRGSTTRRDAGRRGGLEKLNQDPFRASGAFSDAPQGEHALELGQLVVSSDLYGQIRTPSLRNVALTAPYMDEGQMATLDDVLAFYSTRAGATGSGHHAETILKPLDLTADEIADLKAFLVTLTDDSLPEVLRGPPAAAPARSAR
jgi:cytochrome c peroxidase